MLKYIRSQYPEVHKGCFTIIFDNIDRLPDETQIEIIKNIVSLHNSIRCKMVISARLTTLFKFNDFFSNTTSLVENAGPVPVDIIYYRIKYYYDNRDTLQEIIDNRNQVKIAESKLAEVVKDNQFLDFFDTIIATLLKYLSPLTPDVGESNQESRQINSRKERLQKTISALSGLSVRRGLELSKRFFDPQTYFYNEQPSANQLISTLTFTSSRGVKFTDPYVTNIFGRYDDDRRNSWLLYKILNVLKISQDEKLDITIYQLYDIINLYEKENLAEETLINAINVLINSKKRLAYLSGISNLDIKDWDRVKSRQKIHITLSGKEYFSFLVTNLSYIQNCFAALDWKPIGFFIKTDEHDEIITMLSQSEHLKTIEFNFLINSFNEHAKKSYMETIPKTFNGSDIVERMEFIRNGVEILLYHDVIESHCFSKNKYNTEKMLHISSSFSPHFEKINSYPTLRLLLSLSDSFLKISDKYNNPNIKGRIKTELENWKELLIKTDLWHKVLFDTNKSYVENRNKEIDSFIESLNKGL
jgi:hypothetical protein